MDDIPLWMMQLLHNPYLISLKLLTKAESRICASVNDAIIGTNPGLSPVLRLSIIWTSFD